MQLINKTDIGRIRSVNEDSSYIQIDLNGFAFGVVADGMGGHQAGDLASQMAIEEIQLQLQNIDADSSIEQCETALRAAIEQANTRIFEFASHKEQYHGMGTTVVAVLAKEQFLVFAHIGDSRAYLIQSAQIVQLTEDHSLVSELLRSGQITPEEAQRHPRRNVLTRALGTDLTVEVAVGHHIWRAEDIVLLCSDGFSGPVDNNSIIEILHTEKNLVWKADQLVTEALNKGGEDNITVILLTNEPIQRGDQS